MGLVTKFEDLSLNQFIELQKVVNNSELSELDKKIHKLAILMDKTTDEIEDFNNVYFKECLVKTLTVLIAPSDMAVKESIKVNGTVLYPTVSLQDMKVNQLVDFSNLYKAIETDHLLKCNDLLAVMFKPLEGYSPDNHAKISELLLSAKAVDCLALLFFYSDLWKRCEKHIAQFLESQHQMIVELMEEIQTDKGFQDFLNTGDGSITLTNVRKVRE